MPLAFLLVQQATIFEIDLWPGEGIPVFEATTTHLQLHESPTASSRVVGTVNVNVGQGISYDDTRYRTIEVGRFRALATARVKGRLIGETSHLSRHDYYYNNFPTADIELKAGTTFDYLQYRAEGTCFVRIDGSVIDAEACPKIDTATFRLELEPKTEEWIHASVGDVKGWILVNKSTVKEMDRRF